MWIAAALEAIIGDTEPLPLKGPARPVEPTVVAPLVADGPNF